MPDISLPSNQPLVKYTEDQLAGVMKSGDWLPRVQVMGGNSDPVKDGKMPIGIFALVIDATNMTDLGKQLDIAAISVRPKALRLADIPMSYYRLDNEEFQKVQKEAMIKDSGCMFGPEFLIWIPSVEQLALLFLGSKTGRREAPNLIALMKAAAKEGVTYGVAQATLKIKLIKTPKYSWHGFDTLPCSTPMSNLPDPEELQDQLTKFNNPPESTVEKVTDSTGRER